MIVSVHIAVFKRGINFWYIRNKSWKLHLPASPCLKIRLSACNNSSTMQRIFMKFNIDKSYNDRSESKFKMYKFCVVNFTSNKKVYILLLRCPIIFSHSPCLSWGIYLTVRRACLFPVDSSPCLSLSQLSRASWYSQMRPSRFYFSSGNGW
jgi:hypothetical protein